MPLFRLTRCNSFVRAKLRVLYVWWWLCCCVVVRVIACYKTTPTVNISFIWNKLNAGLLNQSYLLSLLSCPRIQHLYRTESLHLPGHRMIASVFTDTAHSTHVWQYVNKPHAPSVWAWPFRREFVVWCSKFECIYIMYDCWIAGSSTGRP
jgi:hypothetical protein